MDAPTWQLSPGYVVDLLEPDVWILRREDDGSMVAAFNTSRCTEADLRMAARRDEQRRTTVDQGSP
jgi:hypothetical protein